MRKRERKINDDLLSIQIISVLASSPPVSLLSNMSINEVFSKLTLDSTSLPCLSIRHHGCGLAAHLPECDAVSAFAEPGGLEVVRFDEGVAPGEAMFAGIYSAATQLESSQRAPARARRTGSSSICPPCL